MKVFNSTKAYEIVNPECPCEQGKALHETYLTHDCLTAHEASVAIAGHIGRVLAAAALEASEKGADLLFFNRSGPDIGKNDKGFYQGRWRGSVVITRYPFTPKINALGMLSTDEDQAHEN